MATHPRHPCLSLWTGPCVMVGFSGGSVCCWKLSVADLPGDLPWYAISRCRRSVGDVRGLSSVQKKRRADARRLSANIFGFGLLRDRTLEHPVDLLVGG